MRWLVEIIDIVADDKRLLADLLAKLNATLHWEENRTYLTSDQFDSLLTSGEVRKQAEQMRDVISEVSNGVPGASINFQLGDLYEQMENGSRHQHVFRSSSTAVLSLSTPPVGYTAAFTREISEEERARLEAEQIEREYQKKLALVSHRIVSAFQDERALKVQRFLQQDLTPARMYHIYELIEEDLKGKLNGLASEKDRIRFKRSVNHPEVFGDDSRHIISNQEPPPNPMSLPEAQAFISRFADSWFQRKCDDESNAQNLDRSSPNQS